MLSFILAAGAIALIFAVFMMAFPVIHGFLIYAVTTVAEFASNTLGWLFGIWGASVNPAFVMLCFIVVALVIALLAILLRVLSNVVG